MRISSWKFFLHKGVFSVLFLRYTLLPLFPTSCERSIGNPPNTLSLVTNYPLFFLVAPVLLHSMVPAASHLGSAALLASAVGVVAREMAVNEAAALKYYDSGIIHQDLMSRKMVGNKRVNPPRRLKEERLTDPVNRHSGRQTSKGASLTASSIPSSTTPSAFRGGRKPFPATGATHSNAAT